MSSRASLANAEQAERFMRASLLPHRQVQPSAKRYRPDLQLSERFGFSFYDSLVVAAALEAGCHRLLTEDLQNGQRVDTLTIENPFLVTAGP